VDLWVFDNDGTLYDDRVARARFMEILLRYSAELLNLPVDLASDEIVRLKAKWHTGHPVLALMRECGIEYSDAVDRIYTEIRLEECGIPTPDIRRFDVLSSIDARKVVFTNNPSRFAHRVLSYVGLSGCFADIIGIEESGFEGKPDPKAFRAVEARHDGFDRIIFCDDSLRNLEIARELGWVTIWYRPSGGNIQEGPGDGHVVISSFEELKTLAPFK
jgi:putative hydrolase of the HAD superfamily